MKKPKTPAGKFRNRIVGHAMVKASELKPHPMNARLHPENQKRSVNGMIEKIGWVDGAIVNKRTGHMLNGHLRRELAGGDELVPVTYVDLDEEEERLVLAGYDPTGAMAVTDDDALASLLAELNLPTDDELRGMLDSLLTGAEERTPHDVGQAAPAAGKGRAVGHMTTPRVQVRPVLYVDELRVFEEAIAATGEANRAKALALICRYFLDTRE